MIWYHTDTSTDCHTHTRTQTHTSARANTHARTCTHTHTHTHTHTRARARVRAHTHTHTSKQSNKQTHKNTEKEKNKNTQDNRTGSKTEILKHTLGNGKRFLYSLLQLTADWYDVLSVFVWITDRSLSALCGRERQTEPPASLHEPHGMSVVLGTKIEVRLEDRSAIQLTTNSIKIKNIVITLRQTFPATNTSSANPKRNLNRDKL